MQTRTTLGCIGLTFLAVACGGSSEELGSSQSALAVVASTAYTLTSGVAGKCVDIAGSSEADAAKVQLWSCNGTRAQSFRLQTMAGTDAYLIARCWTTPATCTSPHVRAASSTRTYAAKQDGAARAAQHGEHTLAGILSVAKHEIDGVVDADSEAYRQATKA